MTAVAVAEKQNLVIPKTKNGRVRQRFTNPIPAEGEGGLFRETWWPICLSSEVAQGQVIGKTFLDGRIVVYRGDDGVARVMSAYCPHMGADLANGEVVGNEVECAFHKWRFNVDGYCSQTGIGDAPPPAACVYAFPTHEKFDIIWAYNGDTPAFELPSFEHPDQIITKTIRMKEPFNADGWEFAANTPDYSHLVAVHNVELVKREVVRREPFFWEWYYEVRHWKGEPTIYRVGVCGSNMFVKFTDHDGRYCATIAGLSCPEPGKHEVFIVGAVLRGADEQSKAEQEEWLSEYVTMEETFTMQDAEILNTQHYTQGSLTKSDDFLSEFLQHMRTYPRHHPSADFIK